jgi:hypothetical protein
VSFFGGRGKNKLTGRGKSLIKSDFVWGGINVWFEVREKGYGTEFIVKDVRNG